MNGRPGPGPEPPADLLAELDRRILPLARRLGVAVGSWRGGEIRWRHHQPSPAEKMPDHPPSQASLADAGQAGRLVFWSPGGDADAASVLADLAGEIVRRREMEASELRLLEELSDSWENLEAIYDLAADWSYAGPARGLLERLMSRLVAVMPGLRAAFWVREGERLAPVISRPALDLSPRPRDAGTIWRAVDTGRAVVREESAPSRRSDGEDSELVGATAVMAAPVITRQGLAAVMVVWLPDRADADRRRPFDSRLLGLVNALGLQAAMVVENERLRQAAREHELLTKEIEIGSRIQQTLLPGRPPEGLAFLDLAALSEPSRLVDGDFYDFFQWPDQTLDVVVGDVMGKGVAAALVGAAAKSQFLRALNGLTTCGDSAPPSPEAIVDMVSEEMDRRLRDLESFITLAYARIDPRGRRLRLVNCGHARPLVRRTGRSGCRLLDGFNAPLGFGLRERSLALEEEFNPGDLLLIYSDGVTEAFDPAGRPFGEELLVDLVADSSDLSASELVGRVRAAVMEHSGAAAADDMTLVAARFVLTGAGKT